MTKLLLEVETYKGGTIKPKWGEQVSSKLQMPVDPSLTMFELWSLHQVWIKRMEGCKLSEWTKYLA